jgi:DnaJ family protein C protein 13
LLKDVLEAWKNEVEKKPPPMTVTEALRALELEGEADWSEKVKRNYRRLAQKFHPDKNPDGRERFEEANRAYEFLCSRYSMETGNPDPNRILLILRAQSILFKRYGYGRLDW